MKKLMMILLTLLVALSVLLIIGCEGNAGKRGLTGDGGDSGNPYSEPVPVNRYFALAIGNNSQIVHNGAPTLYLAFDTLHQSAGDTIVSRHLTGTQVPVIDGVDGGTAEWGDKYTDIALRKIAGYDNGIETARVRSAYDENFVYFQVKWSEVAVPEFGVSASESNDPRRWQHGLDSMKDTTDETGQRWIYAGKNPDIWKVINTNHDEDRLMFLFEITPVFWFEHDGCLVTCHAGDGLKDTSLAGTYFHGTNAAKARMDAWSWSSVTSNPTGYADDQYMDSKGQTVNPDEDLHYTDGMHVDLGGPPTRSNRQTVIQSNVLMINRPIYQHADQPAAAVSYPLWDWQIAKVANAGWDSLATVPWFITSIPTGSRADVVARGKFDNGTWTVELRRVRNTGNGDDAKF
jgi:hypothetical protein